MSERPVYITREGARALQEEVQRLVRDERPRVAAEVQAAAALGDRSENAEYIYGKRRLREIDRRLRYLTTRLDRVTIAESSPRQAGRVFFGAFVTIEDEAGDEHRYRLVGPDESDVEAGKISVESPLGRSLLGKEEGDEVQVRRPKGTAAYTVVSIEYE